MDSFWLKVAIFTAVVLGAVLLVNRFLSSKLKQATRTEKTFSDVIEEDDRRLRAEPEPEQPQPAEAESVAEVNQPAEQKAPAEQPVQQPEPAEPRFEELSEIEKVDAERLFEWALTERKMARLPGPSYKKMVDHCREIIRRYPGSVYAYKAKRMLGEVPERYWAQYNITAEEVKLEK